MCISISSCFAGKKPTKRLLGVSNLESPCFHFISIDKKEVTTAILLLYNYIECCNDEMEVMSGNVHDAHL